MARKSLRGPLQPVGGVLPMQGFAMPPNPGVQSPRGNTTVNPSLQAPLNVTMRMPLSGTRSVPAPSGSRPEAMPSQIVPPLNNVRTGTCRVPFSGPRPPQSSEARSAAVVPPLSNVRPVSPSQVRVTSPPPAVLPPSQVRASSPPPAMRLSSQVRATSPTPAGRVSISQVRATSPRTIQTVQPPLSQQLVTPGCPTSEPTPFTPKVPSLSGVPQNPALLPSYSSIQGTSKVPSLSGVPQNPALLSSYSSIQGVGGRPVGLEPIGVPQNPAFLSSPPSIQGEGRIAGQAIPIAGVSTSLGVTSSVAVNNPPVTKTVTKEMRPLSPFSSYSPPSVLSPQTLPPQTLPAQAMPSAAQTLPMASSNSLLLPTASYNMLPPAYGYPSLFSTPAQDSTLGIPQDYSLANIGHLSSSSSFPDGIAADELRAQRITKVLRECKDCLASTRQEMNDVMKQRNILWDSLRQAENDFINSTHDWSAVQEELNATRRALTLSDHRRVQDLCGRWPRGRSISPTKLYSGQSLREQFQSANVDRNLHREADMQWMCERLTEGGASALTSESLTRDISRLLSVVDNLGVPADQNEPTLLAPAHHKTPTFDPERGGLTSDDIQMEGAYESGVNANHRHLSAVARSVLMNAYSVAGNSSRQSTPRQSSVQAASQYIAALTQHLIPSLCNTHQDYSSPDNVTGSMESGRQVLLAVADAVYSDLASKEGNTLEIGEERRRTAEHIKLIVDTSSTTPNNIALVNCHVSSQVGADLDLQGLLAESRAVRETTRGMLHDTMGISGRTVPTSYMEEKQQSDLSSPRTLLCEQPSDQHAGVEAFSLEPYNCVEEQRPLGQDAPRRASSDIAAKYYTGALLSKLLANEQES